MTTLAVVTVTYSPGASLDAFLDSLATATTHDHQVILADNGSTDGAPERAAERSGVTLLRTGGNLGYGRAANLGVAATDSEWVVVVNPDVVWTPGSLDVLLSAAQRWPRAASLGPLIRNADGSIYPSARVQPGLAAGVGHALLGWWRPDNRWSVAYRQVEDAPVERIAGWLSGSCLLLRRAAFDAVGGFDPAYFMYFEDVDLGDRLSDAGWLNVYVPAAEVVHVGAHATERSASAMQSAHHDSAWRYFAQRHPGPRWLVVRAVVRLGLQARLQLFLRSGGKAARTELGEQTPTIDERTP